MDKTIELLTLLLSNPPLLVAVLMLAVLLAMCKTVWKQLSAYFDEQLTPAKITTTMPRVEAFVLILHSLIGSIAISWCYFATDFPPPASNPNLELQPFGPDFLRFFGYGICFMGIMFAVLALVLRALPIPSAAEAPAVSPIDFIGSKLFGNSRLWFIGVLGAYAWVAYVAFYEPSIVINRPHSENSFDLVMWWCCLVPIVSISAAILIYLPVVALRWLWEQTAKIP